MIRYIDRMTGKVCQEKVFGEKLIYLFYGDSWVSKILFPFLRLSRFYFISYCVGLFQKSSFSKKRITPFVEEYKVNFNEFQKKDFTSFNDFFIRKLKPESRPIDTDISRLVMPVDGRYLVYQIIDQFEIKGKKFDLDTFLQDSKLADQYRKGSMLIGRLAPVDYHRFHFPCTGVASKSIQIGGSLYSVNPIALKKRVQTLFENKRVLTRLQTDRWGQILIVEIGATFVGSIRQTFIPNTFIQKGGEKGYFEFGGSCVVLIFEKDRIQFDLDLIDNTRQGFETKANFGQSLGSIFN